jgi:outer membrane protein assembly factor BamD (BamD/ComL family)
MKYYPESKYAKDAAGLVEKVNKELEYYSEQENLSK